jgi:transposase
MPVAPLPDLDTLDAAALRDMALKQQAQLSSRDEELERLQVQISSHDAELERLRLVIARLQRLRFGRKSEKIQRQLEQLELQLEDLEAGTAEERQQKRRPFRQKQLYANRRGGRCRSISHVKSRRTCRSTRVVQHAAGN